MVNHTCLNVAKIGSAHRCVGMHRTLVVVYFWYPKTAARDVVYLVLDRICRFVHTDGAFVQIL